MYYKNAKYEIIPQDTELLFIFAYKTKIVGKRIGGKILDQHSNDYLIEDVRFFKDVSQLPVNFETPGLPGAFGER